MYTVLYCQQEESYIERCIPHMHRKKKVRKFPVSSRDVTTKLSLGGNYDVITELFQPREILLVTSRLET
jgi:hypothetical protein